MSWGLVVLTCCVTRTFSGNVANSMLLICMLLAAGEDISYSSSTYKSLSQDYRAASCKTTDVSDHLFPSHMCTILCSWTSDRTWDHRSYFFLSLIPSSSHISFCHYRYFSSQFSIKNNLQWHTVLLVLHCNLTMVSTDQNLVTVSFSNCVIILNHFPLD